MNPTIPLPSISTTVAITGPPKTPRSPNVDNILKQRSDEPKKRFRRKPDKFTPSKND